MLGDGGPRARVFVFFFFFFFFSFIYLFTVKPQQLEHRWLVSRDHSNSFLSRYEIFPMAQENKYLGKLLFYHEIVCCVYSLESPHRVDFNEYIQHIIV